MTEKTIEISEVEPLNLFGINDAKLKTILLHFPELKIVSRGRKIKLIGEDNEIERFEKKLQLLFKHLLKFNELSETNIDMLLADE